jgi:hypothetical protein
MDNSLYWEARGALLGGKGQEQAQDGSECLRWESVLVKFEAIEKA